MKKDDFFEKSLPTGFFPFLKFSNDPYVEINVYGFAGLWQKRVFSLQRRNALEKRSKRKKSENSLGDSPVRHGVLHLYGESNVATYDVCSSFVFFKFLFFPLTFVFFWWLQRVVNLVDKSRGNFSHAKIAERTKSRRNVSRNVKKWRRLMGFVRDRFGRRKCWREMTVVDKTQNKRHGEREKL